MSMISKLQLHSPNFVANIWACNVIWGHCSKPFILLSILPDLNFQISHLNICLHSISSRYTVELRNKTFVCLNYGILHLYLFETYIWLGSLSNSKSAIWNMNQNSVSSRAIVLSRLVNRHQRRSEKSRSEDAWFPNRITFPNATTMRGCVGNSRPLQEENGLNTCSAESFSRTKIKKCLILEKG